MAENTWQETLAKSAALFNRTDKARKQASNLLWAGAVEAIEEWLPRAAEDSTGEGLYNEVLEIMGTSRKGDVSKIKKVAMAVKDSGLVLSSFENLAKAYGEATRLTSTAKVHVAEDEAVESAVEAIAESAPKTASTVESAAQVLLSKGLDGAVVAILDAVGADNFEAHRGVLRAFSTEISSRVTAKANAEKQAKEAERAEKEAAKEAERAEKQAAKEKAAAEKKAAAKKATPVKSKSKGDPNNKALPAKKAAAVKPAPSEAIPDEPEFTDPGEPVTSAEGTDMFDGLDDNPSEVDQPAPDGTVPAPVKKAVAAPVRAGRAAPVKRG